MARDSIKVVGPGEKFPIAWCYETGSKPHMLALIRDKSVGGSATMDGNLEQEANRAERLDEKFSLLDQRIKSTWYGQLRGIGDEEGPDRFAGETPWVEHYIPPGDKRSRSGLLRRRKRYG